MKNTTNKKKIVDNEDEYEKEPQNNYDKDIDSFLSLKPNQNTEIKLEEKNIEKFKAPKPIKTYDYEEEELEEEEEEVEEEPLNDKEPEDNMEEDKIDIEEIKKKLDEKYGKIKFDDLSYNLKGYEEFYTDQKDLEYFEFEKGEVVPNKVKLSGDIENDDLELYEGEVAKDGEAKQGFGTLYDKNGVKVGTWKNEQFSGWNAFFGRNGKKAEGRYENGVLTGKGKEECVNENNESTYVGDFVNNIKHGSGVFDNKNYHYEGEYKNKRQDGQGEITYKDKGDNYIGEFKNGTITGNGKMKFNRGDLENPIIDEYEGNFFNGEMEGHGIYKCADGIIFEGDYSNNKKDGNFVITYPNGRIARGKYKDGNVDGNFELEFPDGRKKTIKEKDWKNSK